MRKIKRRTHPHEESQDQRTILIRRESQDQRAILIREPQDQTGLSKNYTGPSGFWRAIENRFLSCSVVVVGLGEFEPEFGSNFESNSESNSESNFETDSAIDRQSDSKSDSELTSKV